MAWDLDEAIGYYKKIGAPGDQNALIGLLREVQQENGGIFPGHLTEIARNCGVKESLLLALIRRIPSLRLANQHCLEICAGPNCAKHKELAAFVEQTYGKNPTDFAVKYVPCMRLCGKGPNVKWDGKLRHGATPQLLKQLISQGEKG